MTKAEKKELVAAVEALLVDVGAMESTKGPSWYGPFEVYDMGTRGPHIDWPNLAKHVNKLRDALPLNTPGERKGKGK